MTAALGCAPTSPSVPAIEFSGSCQPAYQQVRDVWESRIRALGLTGAGLLVRSKGETRCELYAGEITASTAVPLVSAAKWVSATAILAAIEANGLALTDSVGRFFPNAAADARTIRIRQLLSHTSGLPAYQPCMFDRNLTLRQCAETILSQTLDAPPGAGFAYGGAAFTVAGAVAERASGKVWADLFRDRIAGPLGMSAAATYGSTKNPVLSEGEVRASVRDYGKFLQMLLDGGVTAGHVVLSPASVEAMRRNQSESLPIIVSPRGQMSYGLGAWREAEGPDGLATVMSSPGAGGFIPMIDFTNQLLVVFAAFDDINREFPVYQAVVAAVREVER
ncbi:MAG: serine hydrolase domain-containing protein [Gemmatimonadota bacterium]